MEVATRQLHWGAPSAVIAIASGCMFAPMVPAADSAQPGRGGWDGRGGVGGETQRCEPGSDKQHKEAGAKKDLGFRIYNNNQILFGRFVVIKSFC